MTTDFSALFNEKLSALGINTHIDIHQFDTIVQLFEAAFIKHADLAACSSLGQMLTYRELDQLSADFAAWLQHESGLQQGDRVAIQMPNLIQYLVVCLGTLRAGMVVVNTNPLYTERELTHQFTDADVQLLVVQANVAATAAKVLPKTNVKQVIVTELADLHRLPKRLLINWGAKYIKKMVPEFHIPGAKTLRSILAAGRKHQYQPVSMERDALAMLQYTGGTTGLAKGAMLSHGNLVSNVLQCDAVFATHAMAGPGNTFIQPLPVYHIYAFTASMYGVHIGSHTVYLPNPRDLGSVVDAMAQYRPALFCGLNTLFVALSNDPDFRALDFTNLRVTLSGGMALTEAAAKRWQDVTGCAIFEGYGLTETSPVATTNPGNGNQLGTIGLPMPLTELKVIDAEGHALGTDEAGELCIRGPQVMLGYWQRPEATDEVLSEDGWFATGDVAVIQPDGYTRIVDRKKDMIVVSGFNVYPNELEDVLSKHPGVLECAAVGIPDPTSGEVIKMFVVRQDPTLTEAQVRDFCREHLTAYKVPKLVAFRDELPKTNVGKILRRELRDAETRAD